MSPLDTLFPPVGIPNARRQESKQREQAFNGERGESKGRGAREVIPTSWAAIYTLELRGMTQAQIAENLGLTAPSISRIVRDPRYIAYREQHLAELDHEFVAMKPLAFAALRGGLGSSDENTALRASEQWFKAAGFGGFSKVPERPTTTSAEDVVAQLLNINGNVTVNIQNNNVVTSEDAAE